MAEMSGVGEGAVVSIEHMATRTHSENPFGPLPSDSRQGFSEDEATESEDEDELLTPHSSQRRVDAELMMGEGGSFDLPAGSTAEGAGGSAAHNENPPLSASRRARSYSGDIAARAEASSFRREVARSTMRRWSTSGADNFASIRPNGLETRWLENPGETQAQETCRSIQMIRMLDSQFSESLNSLRGRLESENSISSPSASFRRSSRKLRMLSDTVRDLRADACFAVALSAFCVFLVLLVFAIKDTKLNAKFLVA